MKGQIHFVLWPSSFHPYRPAGVDGTASAILFFSISKYPSASGLGRTDNELFSQSCASE
jgi:hypothetical protein